MTDYREMFKVNYPYPDSTKIKIAVEKEMIPKAASYASLKELADAINQEVKIRYNAERNKYHEALNACQEKAKQRLLSDAGFDSYNKTIQDAAYSIAWERGHSCGYHDVYCELCELVEFVDVIVKSIKDEK